MKKITLLLVMLLAVVGVKAGDYLVKSEAESLTTVTSWEGWFYGTTISKDNFAILEEGDAISAEISGTNEYANLAIKTATSGTEIFAKGVNGVTSIKSQGLTATEVDAIKSEGIQFQGTSYTYRNVKIVKNADITLLTEDAKDLDWSQSAKYSNLLTSAVAGDKIFIVGSNKGGYTMRIRVEPGWLELYGGDGGAWTVGDQLITLTEGDALTALQGGAALAIDGGTNTIQKIYLIHPTVTNEKATIGAGGMGTFYSSHKVSVPEGLTAYIATLKDESTINLSAIDNIPANTGVILSGAKGVYQFATTDETAATTIGNLLKGTSASMTFPTGDNYYVLYYDLTEKRYEFRHASGILAANKAYLEIPSGNTPARLGIIFDEGETTTISELKAQKTVIDDGAYYNLAGQRVDKPTKGLYIVNGKKIIIK